MKFPVGPCVISLKDELRSTKGDLRMFHHFELHVNAPNDSHARQMEEVLFNMGAKTVLKGKPASVEYQWSLVAVFGEP